MKGTILLDSRTLTVVAHLPLRNQLIAQGWNLAKAHGSHLTTNRSLTPALFLMLVFASPTTYALAQSGGHPYLSQSAISMQQMLQVPCEQGFERAPLEVLLDSVASAYEITIWCDRRIARDTPVTIERREETLESFLNRAIIQADAVLIPLAGVLMVCPRANRDAVDAAHWRLSVARSASALRPLGAKPFSWPDGYVASAAIQDFVARCMPDANWNIKIDKDIWRAFEFPKTTTAASISICMLSGFNLCLEEQEGKLVVAPIAIADSKVEWTYSKEDVKRIGEAAWKSWRERWPDATFVKSTKPDGWRVSATVASHRDLIAPLIPKKKWEKPKPSEVGLDRRVFSQTINDQELERVIRSLAAATKLEFYPLPLPASLEAKKVTMKLDKTPLDAILKEITNQCGVKFRRDGQRIEIIP